MIQILLLFSSKFCIMPVPVGSYQTGPSCWDRMKMGFTIGFCVGMASGALFGGFSALRYMRIYNAVEVCNMLFLRAYITSLFCQVRTPWKRISEQCGEDDASRWRNVWNIYGYWNRHQVLSVIKYCYNSSSDNTYNILYAANHINMQRKLCASCSETKKTESRKFLSMCIIHVLCSGLNC